MMLEDVHPKTTLETREVSLSTTPQVKISMLVTFILCRQSMFVQNFMAIQPLISEIFQSGLNTLTRSKQTGVTIVKAGGSLKHGNAGG